MADVVEVIIEVEKYFGVQIADERAERLEMVGDLYLFLLGQSLGRDLNTYLGPRPCLSHAKYYR
jgi:hypothetical protein